MTPARTTRSPQPEPHPAPHPRSQPCDVVGPPRAPTVGRLRRRAAVPLALPLASAGTSARLDHAVVLVVVALAAVYLGRVVVGGGLMLASALPGATGRLAHRAAARVTPLLVRRVLVALLGAGQLVAVGPAWGVPASDRAAASVTTSTPRPAATASYVVRAGDCLWDIARAHLPAHAAAAQVDRTWRRWYAVNRAVIGADPGLLRVGEVLVEPGPRPARPDGSPPSGRPGPPRSSRSALASIDLDLG